MRCALPEIDNNFYTFCVKKHTVLIVSERGYDIPEVEREIFLDARTQKSAYRAFLREYRTQGKEVVKYPALDWDYPAGSGHGDTTTLKVRFCLGLDLENRVTEEVTIKKNLESRRRKSPVEPTERHFLFILDGVAELKVAIDSHTIFETILFQQLYMDPRKHIYANRTELVPTEEASEIFGTKSMRGITCTQMSQRDPLTLFMGLEKGDIVREHHDNVYCGHPKATINYRVVR
jgi:DNA-directed RNA polymerase subunit H (RpoH/RPB5)